MVFRDVCLETPAVELPPEVVTSADLERRLAPLYQRLRLPEGRLELMTGIRERRFWPDGVRPSEAAARAGEAALARSAVPRERIGLLVHAAVCRDMLEPATAAFVHRRLGLGADCQVFDVSNACLGFLNAVLLAGGLLDAGQIEAALVVTAENGRPLLEETVRRLLAGGLDRRAIKPYFANLTIGGGACAAVVRRASTGLAGGHRLRAAAVRAESRHNALCLGDAVGGGGLAMETDAEQLLEAGLGVARGCWADFRAATGWEAATTDRFICHQVGAAHRRRLCAELGLDLARDFSTFETLGNAGSASCPLTLGLAAEGGFVLPGHRVAVLGIGSGINCVMLGVEW